MIVSWKRNVCLEVAPLDLAVLYLQLISWYGFYLYLLISERLLIVQEKATDKISIVSKTPICKWGFLRKLIWSPTITNGFLDFVIIVDNC